MRHKIIFRIFLICLFGLVWPAGRASAFMPVPRLRFATPSGVATSEARLISKTARFRGEISAIGSNSLTVSGKTINIDATTRLVRKFGAKSTLAEFSVGDNVMVAGTWTDDTKTAVNARFIRNFSIQKRHGVFFGTIKSLGANSFVMTTIRRGDQSVTPDAKTKFVKRNMTPMTFADLKIGDRIRVKGLWDNKLNQVTEVSQIKGYSLPVKTTSK